MSDNNKKSSILPIIIICVLAVVIASYFFLNKSKNQVLMQKPGLADEAAKSQQEQRSNQQNASQDQNGAPPKEGEAQPVPLANAEPKARDSYIAAAREAKNGTPEKAVENLHDAFKLEPGLINNALLDQNFKNIRNHPDFEKLLQIQGRDIYKDLGKPPIELPK